MKKFLASILSCALLVSMCATTAYATDSRHLSENKTLTDAIQDDLSNAPEDESVPVSYNILNDVVAMSAGSYHSAAITANGTLYTWGRNSFGQLGNGQTSESSIPVQVMSNVAYVSAGASHTAAITTDGTLWTWGSNGAGKLGNGKTVDSYVPVKVMRDVVSVSAGGTHTAALKKDGTLWMFGSNKYGQLADSTTTDALSPVCVMRDVSAVNCGEACTAIIKTDGSLWLCGSTHPSIQDNTLIFLSPTKIMDDVRSVSCGYKNFAAIKADHSLWTWGDNNEGAVGIGTISGLVRQPTKIMDDVAQVAVGDDHTIALKSDGSVWGWGALYAGQAGKSIYNNANIVSDGIGRKVRHTPLKIIDNAHYITAGHDHSFALEQNGSLWAWGNNAYGQLSDTEIKDSTYQWSWSYEGSTVHYSEDIQEVPISIGSCGATLLPNVVNTVSIPSDWAAAGVSAANQAGLVPSLTGNPGYQDAITREQFAELVAHAANVIYGGDLFDMAEVEKVHFSDCDNEAVRQAASIGIVTGVGDGKFAPAQTTNREQIATMIVRAIEYLNDKDNKNVAPNEGDIEKFTDKGQVSAWAVDSVGVLAANGIMAGTSATTLSPKDSCTVEQSILLLYRVYQLFAA